MVAGALSIACRADAPAPIQLGVGPSAAERLSFVPQRTFAEYLVIPGRHNELRITAAEYEASCERFVPPGEGQASVTVTVVTPSDTPPAAGTYAWGGLGAEAASRPHARPAARVGRTSYQFQPGGSMRLTEVDLDGGRVAGVLAFEFPGDADHPASSVRGRFLAKICPGGRASPP